MKIIAIVVTYNRLSLLKESISALLNQTHPLYKIIIVDNHSTDGTFDYLANLAKENSIFQIVTMEQNVGGSGGFSEGVKQAAYAHADWMWLMDDDTIPQEDALEQLLPYTSVDEVGFVCSKVVWIDGTPHLMNCPTVLKDQSMKTSILSSTGQPLEKTDLVSMASFVSLLVRGSIPWKLGLPYKEFFIWCDDAEYTTRISNNGYYGILVKDSIVLHKTRVNYVSSLKTMPPAEAWKLYYGVRNESFMRRKRKGWVRFLFAQLNCFRTHAHRIKSRHLPKEDEKALLKQNNRGPWDGFTFNPQIEYLTTE